jgi:hypothetical protein
MVKVKSADAGEAAGGLSPLFSAGSGDDLE